MIDSYPLISIVTPSYNQAEFLEETIRSVLDQDYPNIEYIVIDGGSTDGSVEIIKKYADRLAYWVSEKDRGQADAIKKGFARATGEIIGWLNSDDLYLPRALTTVATSFAESPDVGMVSGGCVFTTSKGEFVTESPAEARTLIGELMNPGILQPNTFFRRHLYEQAGGIDETFRNSMDADLWVRLLMSATYKPVPANLATYRLHAHSKTALRGTTRLFARDWLRTADKFLNTPAGQELAPPVRRNIRTRRLLRTLETWEPNEPEARDLASRVKQITPRVTTDEVIHVLAETIPPDLLEQVVARDPSYLEQHTYLIPIPIEMVERARYTSLDVLVRQGILDARSANRASRALRSYLMLHYMAMNPGGMDGHALRRRLVRAVILWPKVLLARRWISLLLQSWEFSRPLAMVLRDVRHYGLRSSVRSFSRRSG